MAAVRRAARWGGEGEARGASSGRIAESSLRGSVAGEVGWEGGAGDALRFETHGRGLGARGLSLEGRDELQRYYWCKYCY